MKKLFKILTLMVGTMFLCAIPAYLSLRGTGGEFVYPLDDTYIHLLMAKNLAESGVWGIEPHAYAFCSSSPLWTIILAISTKLFGYLEILPWFISLFCVGLTAVVSDRLLSRGGVTLPWRVASGILIAFSAPYCILSGLGMEHALHVLLIVTLFLTYLSLGESSFGHGNTGADDSFRRFFPALCLVSALGTATRYETLFIALPLAAGFLFERRWKSALVFLLSSVAPCLIYGCYAVSHGGHFLPNSLLRKGAALSASSFLTTLKFVIMHPSVGAPIMYFTGLMLLVVLLTKRIPKRILICLLALVMAIGGYLVFIVKYQYFRYEAFLITASALMLTAAVVPLRGKFDTPFLRSLGVPTRYSTCALWVLLLATGWFYCQRGISAIQAAIHAPRDIYRQQVQFTRMMAALPDKDKGVIALNDLGYLGLHGKAPVVDLWGLGSQDSAEMNIAHGGWDQEIVQKLLETHDAKYAVVFPEWFPASMFPTSFIHTAVLSDPENRVCASKRVWFYARGKDASRVLSQTLESYRDKLPEGVGLVVFSSPAQ